MKAVHVLLLLATNIVNRNPTESSERVSSRPMRVSATSDLWPVLQQVRANGKKHTPAVAVVYCCSSADVEPATTV